MLTMACLKVRLATLFVVTICFALTASHEGCKEVQYLELFESGTIQCSFQDDYESLQWYKSTEDGRVPLVIFLNSKKSGPGYLSGEYDIYPNGSLIIANVTLQHERIFSVSVSAGDIVDVYHIRVETIVTPTIPYPTIAQCKNQQDICYIANSKLHSLDCFVANARPKVSFIWSKRIGDRDRLLPSQSNYTHGNDNTFWSFATVQLSNILPLLSAFVCSVEVNPWLLKEDEALIILESKDIDLTKESVKYNFQLHSAMIIPCIDADIVVWKRTLGIVNDMEVILINVKNRKNNFTKIYNDDFLLKRNGSLVLQRIGFEHEGLYICLSMVSKTEHVQINDVAIFVNPSPPYLVVDGCNHEQYCVLEVEREGNVTCSVRGIWPEVELQWINYYHDTVVTLKEHQVKSSQNEKSFDISLTTNFKFEGIVEGRLTLECFVVGPNSNMFRFSTKVDLLPTFDKQTHSTLNIAWLIPVFTAVLLIAVLLAIVYKVTRKPTTFGRNHETFPMIDPGKEEFDRFSKELKYTYKVLYDAVQPIPYIKDRMYCVNKIFVESSFEVLEKTAHHLELIWKPFGPYQEIPNKHMKSHRQIIEGEPGYGKSTLMLQLVYDWCNNISNSPIHNVNILIFLRLRQLSGVSSIYEAIKRFTLPRDSSFTEDDVRSFISNYPSVLILLDGYDEYPDKDNPNTDIASILRKEMFQDVNVILTTRSFYLPNDVVPQTDRLRLLGFNDDARDEYIHKAVVGGNIEAAEKITLKLQHNPVLGDLCQVPLFFVMFAHMTHESKDFQTFKSVTSFFRYMISCFHSHMRNKIKNKDARMKNEELEHRHGELNKVAFEALSGKNQHLMWDSTTLQQRLGKEFYNHYIRIGILLEEEVQAENRDALIHVQYKKNVRFYHKLFCEWYAAQYIAHYLSEDITNNHLKELLGNMDPFDLQYFYRFACGLNKNCSDKIVTYLQENVKEQRFAILCMLEQDDKTEHISNIIKQILSKPVKINFDDSKLLQRSTLQILEFATKTQIPISCLHLNKSSHQFNKDSFVLRSGLTLPKLLTVEKIIIETYEDKDEARTLEKNEIVQIFSIGMQSQRLQELTFDGCLLPLPFPMDIIPVQMRSDKIKVSWRRYGYSLNLRFGTWEVDDMNIFKRLCSDMVVIKKESSQLMQRCTIQLLDNASKYNIPIFDLWLINSFRKCDDGRVLLHSGLGLSCPSSLEKVWIKEDGKEMTETDVLGLLTFVKQSNVIKELSFYRCFVPQFIHAESIPAILKSKNFRVCWNPKQQYYDLNLDTGRWINQRTGLEIPDEEYAKVTNG